MSLMELSEAMVAEILLLQLHDPAPGAVKMADETRSDKILIASCLISRVPSFSVPSNAE